MLIQYQDQNGAVDVQGLMQIMNSLKDEIKVMKGHQVRKKSHERHEESKVAAAPYQGQSACAGLSTSQDPSPAHSMHSHQSKGSPKPVSGPQWFSLSTRSGLGTASIWCTRKFITTWIQSSVRSVFIILIVRRRAWRGRGITQSWRQITRWW